MADDVLILEKEARIYADAIARHYPDLVVRTASRHDEAMSCCAGASIVIALAHEISADLVAAMPKLRWVQALTTGTDSLTALSNLPSRVVVTSARGIHGPQMSEMAFLYMVALSRNFRRMLTNQAAARWERWPQTLLLGKTALVLGVGSISEELARRCQAFGMRVIGISSHRAAAEGFDAIHPRDRLADAAREADFLIILIPYSRATHHIVDATVLAALRPHAVVINLARGNVIDEEALVTALIDGRIAGAGLDVFATEPLPEDSPLWRLDNVIVTPRVGGMSDIYAQQVLPLVIENLGHFLAGRPEAMRNIVAR